MNTDQMSYIFLIAIGILAIILRKPLAKLQIAMQNETLGTHFGAREVMISEIIISGVASLLIVLCIKFVFDSTR